MKKILGIVIIALFGGLVFLAFTQSEQSNQAYPDPKEYAPNFWFDSEEKYYPTNPLDFYYDEELNELGGKEAKAAYDVLPQEEKLKNFRVFYNIEDSGSQLVYQYWLFYVFNDASNEHYGDWESVFVFVDIKNKEVIRSVGSSHQGGSLNTEVKNNKLKSTQHSWNYVGVGSHANCVDYEGDGRCNSWLWNITEGWPSFNDVNAVKVSHNSPHYDLRPISEIKDVFGKKYGEDRPLITKEKSPILGMLPIKIGAKKIHALPLGGDPPQNAWLKKEYKNPEEVVPMTPSRFAKKAGSAIASIGKALSKPAKLDVGGPASVTTRDDAEIAEITVNTEITEITASQNPRITQSRPPPPSPKATEGAAPSPSASSGQASELETEISFVTKVIDGDTIELQSGERVRYIGIDAPEDLLECYAEEASAHNKSLVEGKQVVLLKWPKHSDKDKYDRLLRFVWLDFYQDGKIDSTDTFVNLDLIARGYARENDYGETHKYKHRFETAEQDAKRQELGLWSSACNKKAESLKEAGRDVIQAVEKIVDNITALRPFEIAPNVFQFPPQSSGGSAPASTPTPTPTPSPEPAKRIVINEIQTGDGEFVELYNQFSSAKSLAGYYFSYYSSSKIAWNDPWRNKKFPDGAKIPANGYYLIGLKDYPTFAGNPSVDWQPYSSAQLGNSAGTVAIFPFDPSATTSESAYTGRTDAVGWGSGLTLYEQSPASAPDSGKSITRNSSHSDTDNNSSDFSQSASPTPTNTSGKTYDSGFSSAPLWQIYQKDGRHPGLTSFAGPTWTSSSQATSSWTFQMKKNNNTNSGGRSQAVVDYAGNIYVVDSFGIVHALKPDGTSLWTFKPEDETGVGAGWAESSPALSANSQRLYSVYTDTSSSKLWLFSIKTSDGTLDWKYSVTGVNEIFTSPALDTNGSIYVASNSRIYSVSSAGVQNWTKELSASGLGVKIPAVGSDGYIYVIAIVTNSAGDRYLWKLNASDGSEVWKVNPIGNNSLSNPVSINASGTIYTGGSKDARLYSVNPADGSKNWGELLNSGGSGNVTGPMPNFDASGNIYVGTSGTFDIGAMHKLSATGTQLWAFTSASPGSVKYPAAIDTQGRVYFGTKDKYVYALKSEDGTEIWKYQLSDEPVGLVVGKDVVYAVSYDGKIYALK